jgi:phage terminase large subunit
MLRASETGLVAQEELDAARKMMTPEQYEQEFECSFDAAILGAYWGREMAQAERDGRICDVPVDPSQPVYTAWDLGRGRHGDLVLPAAVRRHQRGRLLRQHPNQGAPHYAEVLHARAEEGGYKLGPCLMPHDAKVTEWGTDRTRIESLQRWV